MAKVHVRLHAGSLPPETQWGKRGGFLAKEEKWEFVVTRFWQKVGSYYNSLGILKVNSLNPF